MGLMQTKFFTRALALPAVVAILKRVVPPLDRFLLRVSRGWLNTALQPVALVNTTGAKSGKRRAIATICMPVEGGIVVVGSNWGGDRDPAWVHNLRAHPQVEIAFRGYVGPAVAREVTGEERARLWRQMVAYSPQHAVYQAGTSRLLPVLLLEW